LQALGNGSQRTSISIVQIVIAPKPIITFSFLLLFFFLLLVLFSLFLLLHGFVHYLLPLTIVTITKTGTTLATLLRYYNSIYSFFPWAALLVKYKLVRSMRAWVTVSIQKIMVGWLGLL
jgi:hypothetical protein